jgi:hypothetical protein
MWGVMWGALTILKVAEPRFSGPCVTQTCVSAPPAGSANVLTLACKEAAGPRGSSAASALSRKAGMLQTQGGRYAEARPCCAAA